MVIVIVIVITIPRVIIFVFRLIRVALGEAEMDEILVTSRKRTHLPEKRQANWILSEPKEP